MADKPKQTTKKMIKVTVTGYIPAPSFNLESFKKADAKIRQIENFAAENLEFSEVQKREVGKLVPVEDEPAEKPASEKPAEDNHDGDIDSLVEFPAVKVIEHMAGAGTPIPNWIDEAIQAEIITRVEGTSVATDKLEIANEAGTQAATSGDTLKREDDDQITVLKSS